MPGASPVSAAARAVTPPSTLPGSRTGGKTAVGKSTSSMISRDQVRAARSNMPELDPHDGSVANSPDSRARTQSLSIVTWATRARTSGSWAMIQSRRAGEVIDTQSPPVSKILRASPRRTRIPASSTARESTFGQAQISVPSSSYRTMPSRMLVLLTAATSAGSRPAAASASRMQAQTSDQLVAVSNTCEPG